jgi:hypothetical protein
MTPQEKDLTTILLDRLNMTEGEKDPEAEDGFDPLYILTVSDPLLSAS